MSDWQQDFVRWYYPGNNKPPTAVVVPAVMIGFQINARRVFRWIEVGFEDFFNRMLNSDFTEGDPNYLLEQLRFDGHEWSWVADGSDDYALAKNYAYLRSLFVDCDMILCGEGLDETPPPVEGLGDE